VTSQSVIRDARVVQVRALKGEIDRLKEENGRLRDENAAWRRHVDLAVLAAADLRALPPEGRFLILDGWNLILGAMREAASPAELEAQAKRHLETHPHDFVWIVFDGPNERSRQHARLRVSYTGGTGPHRADRLICDFLRMARWTGDLARVDVRTNDKDFKRTVSRLRDPDGR
jgi:hypothetical protein